MYLSVLGLISKGLLCFPNQKAQRFGGSWGHIKTISIWFIGWWNLASWQMLDLQPWCWAKDIHLCALFWEILTVQKLALFFLAHFLIGKGSWFPFWFLSVISVMSSGRKSWLAQICQTLFFCEFFEKPAFTETKLRLGIFLYESKRDCLP